ncbi:MAG: DUF4870 domain-containing protein [Phycisphaeraceae bacterium]|nr:DUF4870 domain-containing protein [Phycisphaeraceae bacterium]MCB9846974.1 DUF4870 domain-containing protein [Phycisphaeraceae bacterium]
MIGDAATMNNGQSNKWQARWNKTHLHVSRLVEEGPLRQSEALRDEHATEAERTYTTFQHLVGLVSALDAGMGLMGMIGSIVMWRIKSKESPFYDDHGREAVNFQLSLFVYFIVGWLILALFTLVTLGFGVVLAAPIGGLGIIGLIVLRFVGCIRGAIAANRGEYYRYPMCLRFLV